MTPEDSADDQLVIGVAIPCRNDANFLRVCLDKLAAQTRPPDFVVVVDNGSTDDSAQVAADRGAIVLTQERVGIWPAASMAYDEVSRLGADVIARLDTDSVPPPDWVAQIDGAFSEDPELEGLTGMGDFYGGTRFSRWFGRHCYLGLMVSIMNPWLGNPVLFGSNSAMRVSVWQRMRGRVLSNRADIHDDFELSIRMRPTDKVVYDDDFRVGVSARPFDGPRAFFTRIGKALRTLRITWPESNPLWRRRRGR